MDTWTIILSSPSFMIKKLVGWLVGWLVEWLIDKLVCSVHYQTVLTCLVLVALSIYLLRPGTKPPPAPAPPPAKPADSPSASPSPQPYLWTQDNSPIYGSPIYRRSPQSQVSLIVFLLFVHIEFQISPLSNFQQPKIWF